MKILTSASGVQGVADHELLRLTRKGDRASFGELWRRHAASGTRVARAVTDLDPDDIVAEAFERILRVVLDGRGPTGGFRPYLYTTIRHVAASRGRSRREIAVDDLDALVELDNASIGDDVAVIALDKSLTAQAFRSLPERWQTVLWYTEVEGLDPHEAAPLLGLNANATAALSFRAREGLRVAWLQAHVDDVRAGGECRWATQRLGERERQKLSARDADRLAFHLTNCARCAIISEEVHEVGSRLRSVLLPLLVGSGAALALEQFFGNATGVDRASALSGAELGNGVALPDGVVALFGASGAGVSAVIAKVAAGAVLLMAGASGTIPPVVVPNEAGVGTTGVSSNPGVGDDGAVLPGAGLDPGSMANGAGELPLSIPSSAILPSVVDHLVGGVVDTITGGQIPLTYTAPGGIVSAVVMVTIIGTATPGAHLSLQAAGHAYGTTTVRDDGSFTIAATAVPSGLTSLDLVQAVNSAYLAGLVTPGGLLGGLSGELSALIQALIRPIVIGSRSPQLTIVLVN